MAFLFIDSTYDISLGLLDENLEWKCFETFSGLKASSVLQKETHRLLQAGSIKIDELDGIITMAGPGFYTGLRLSEGFADVLIFNGLRHYSFYTHSIPSLLDIKEGVWVTKAYRGEYFFHHWDKGQSKNELIPLKELSVYVQNMKSKNVYIHSQVAIDQNLLDLFGHSTETRSLLKEKSSIIFNKVLLHNLRENSFYFRAPEDEFKANP